MKKILSMLFLATLIWSCQKKETTEETTASESFDLQREAFFSNMLAQGEAAASLQATGAEFNANIMNDPALSSSYTTSNEKTAANLGIYLADLNYSAAYKQSEHSKALYTATQELSKAIDIEQSVLVFLMARYDEAISQNDSLSDVINEEFKKSTTDLKGTDREKLVGIAMAAYQIENLHLALGIIEGYPKDMLPGDARTVILIPVYRMVLYQEENIKIISSFLKAIANPEENPNYAYYTTAFEELIALYQRLDVEEKMANNQGLELMTDAVMQELSSKINAIRNKIVSPQ